MEPRRTVNGRIGALGFLSILIAWLACLGAWVAVALLQVHPVDQQPLVLAWGTLTGALVGVHIKPPGNT